MPPGYLRRASRKTCRASGHHPPGALPASLRRSVQRWVNQSRLAPRHEPAMPDRPSRSRTERRLKRRLFRRPLPALRRRTDRPMHGKWTPVPKNQRIVWNPRRPIIPTGTASPASVAAIRRSPRSPRPIGRASASCYDWSNARRRPVKRRRMFRLSATGASGRADRPCRLGAGPDRKRVAACFVGPALAGCHFRGSCQAAPSSTG